MNDEHRFARLLRILRYLATDGYTTRQLTELTGEGRRNIQRDIAFLRRHCFEIVHDPKTGRYRLIRDREFLAQTLSLEEVLSLELGMSLLRQHLGILGQDAVQKLQYFLKMDKKLAAREFPDRVAVANRGDNPDCLVEVMRALTDRRQIRFLYKEERRTVDPYTLFFQDERWYLQGHDHLRGELRTFRLQRISRLERLDVGFVLPEGYSAESALFHKWDLGEGAPVEITCKVSNELGRWLQENPVHSTQELKNGELRLHIRNLEAFGAWLLGLTGIEIIAPTELKNFLRTRLEGLVGDHFGRVLRL